MPDHRDDLDGLATELRLLAAHLDVPEPADQRSAVRARLAAAPAPGRPWYRRVLSGATRARGALSGAARARRPLSGAAPARPALSRAASVRRWVLAAVAVLIAVLAGVAPARAAVVDAVGGLLRIAGIEVRPDPAPGTLPPTPAPLPSLRTAGLADARRVALFPVRVPAALGAPERVELGDPDSSGAPRVVTLVYRGGAVRLDQFDGAVSPSFFKSAPAARWMEIAGAQALWLPEPHPVAYVGRDGAEHTGTARLAGPTLIWSGGGVSYRLEGLTDLEEARTVAVSLG